MGDGALILLDTNAVLWSVSGSPRLSSEAKRVIEEERQRGPVHIASISLLEIARLIAAKRLEIAPTRETFLSNIEREFAMLDITAAIAATTTRLPDSYPRDPADRIIGATALVHGAILVTADKLIRKSKAVRTLW